MLMEKLAKQREKHHVVEQGHNKLHCMPYKNLNKKICNHAMVSICWAKVFKSLFVRVLLLNSIILALPK